MICALSAALRLRIYEVGVNNSFQCTTKENSPENPPIYITIPPLNMPWFKKYFPNVKLNGVGPYVLQCLKLMQGTKPAG